MYIHQWKKLKRRVYTDEALSPLVLCSRSSHPMMSGDRMDPDPSTPDERILKSPALELARLGFAILDGRGLLL